MREELRGELRWIVAEGSYGDGSEGNPDARLLVGALEAALERDESVVLDLREMHYGFGDAIGELFWLAKAKPVRFLLRAECSEAYQGLLDFMVPNWFQELRPRLRFD